MQKGLALLAGIISFLQTDILAQELPPACLNETIRYRMKGQTESFFSWVVTGGEIVNLYGKGDSVDVKWVEEKGNHQLNCVEILKAGCQNEPVIAEVEVYKTSLPFEVDTICEPPEGIWINSGNYKKYEWSTGSSEPAVFLSKYTGKLWLKVRDDHDCETLDTVFLKPCEDGYQLFIPNVFTPNGDGANDVWELIGAAKYPKMKVHVFDRWGRQVYQSDFGYGKPWDGRLQGKELPVEAYYYVIDPGNGDQTIRGTVTILR